MSTIKKIQSIVGWPATKEQVAQAMEFIPDDFVLKISATGTPDEARAKVQPNIASAAAPAPFCIRWAMP